MTTCSLITIAIDNTASFTDANFKDVIHKTPGAHVLDAVTLGAGLTDFEWDDGDNTPQLPMTAADAREHMDEDGYLTAVLAVSQDSYLEQHGYATTEGADTHEDLVHHEVFDFGLPYDCRTRLLAVQGDDFIVAYTTRIAEFL